MKETPERILQLIYNLEESHGAVKSIELSKILGLNRPDIFRALKALKIFGYIDQKHYGKITLTDKGKGKAEQMLTLHKGLTILLQTEVGLSPDEANDFSYKIEHVMPEEAIKKTVEALKRKNII